MTETRWQVRTLDGAVVSFPAVEVMRAWIAAGRLAGDDQVSADGVSWRRLDSVPELMAFSPDSGVTEPDRIAVEVTDIVEVQEFADDGAYVGSTVVTLDEVAGAREPSQEAHTRVLQPPSGADRGPGGWPDVALRPRESAPSPVRDRRQGRAGPWMVLLVGALVGMILFIYWRETTVHDRQMSRLGPAASPSAPIEPATGVAAADPVSSVKRGVDESLTAVSVADPPPLEDVAPASAPPVPTLDVSPGPEVVTGEVHVARKPPPAPTAPTAPTERGPAAGTMGFDGSMRAGSRALKRGDTQTAMGHFRRAVALRPNNPEVHDRLGRALLKAGSGGEALETFKRCLRTSARYGPCLFGLGRAHERVGAPLAARQAYQQYLDKHPDGSYASRVRQRLESLGP